MKNSAVAKAIEKLNALEGINYPEYRLVRDDKAREIIEQLEIDILNEYNEYKPDKREISTEFCETQRVVHPTAE